jgi:REP element-mobilizing transposase RayT
MKTDYQNRLPHIAPLGATFFVTFRMADALPQKLVLALKTSLEIETNQIQKEFPGDKQRIRDARKRHFAGFDHQLDKNPYGACYLRKPEVAKIVIDKILEYDGSLFDLQAYTIMPNHVHVLFSMARQIFEKNENCLNEAPEHYVQLDKVMHLIKGGSSILINQHLGRTGRFWFKDSYDHFVRKESEWLNIANYILRNPDKAGLVKHPGDWPFSFCQAELLDQLLFRA